MDSPLATLANIGTGGTNEPPLCLVFSSSLRVRLEGRLLADANGCRVWLSKQGEARRRLMALLRVGCMRDQVSSSVCRLSNRPRRVTRSDKP